MKNNISKTEKLPSHEVQHVLLEYFQFSCLNTSVGKKCIFTREVKVKNSSGYRNKDW